jgi:hypothetical protein
MAQLAILFIGLVLLLILGVLYLIDKSFVRMIARNPAAVDAPLGNVMRIGIGCVLIMGAVLCGFALWQGITELLTPL